MDEELDGLVGDAIFGVVEEDAHGLGRHPLAALRVIREKLSQMETANPLVVRLQGVPRIPPGQRFNSLRLRAGFSVGCHLHAPLPFTSARGCALERS